MAAITVALLGGESSGKTTLGLALTQQLNALGVNATLVPEHLRTWCEREGRAPLVHEQAAMAAEQRASFVAEALAAEQEMLETGLGYDADDVHAYIDARLAGKNPDRPVLKPWRS